MRRMAVSESYEVELFLRSYLKEFTVEDFIKHMGSKRIRMTEDKAMSYFQDSPYLFILSSGKLLTRAGAFTGKCFSFTLTPQEIKNRMFVPGHRFMPFVDSGINTSSFIYLCENEVLEHCVGEFRKEQALALFRLYGEEYESQYIASDPANSDIDFAAAEYELPPFIKLSGCSIGKFIDEMDLCAGDRIYCRVSDWNNSVIEIFPEHKPKADPDMPVMIDSISQARAEWNAFLESAFIECFEHLGPCSSIEEQIANVFFEYDRELCVDYCDSVENCLSKSKKIDFELFGVETRLWKKGEVIPAVGPWNNIGSVPLPEDKNSGKERYTARNFEKIPFTVPDYALDCYLRNLEFKKLSDVEPLINEMYPQNYMMTLDERESVLLHITNQHDIIHSSYNWFADFPLGEVRERALKLYSKVCALVYDVESSSVGFEKFPQQELVILSQLYSHMNRLLESMSLDPDSIINEIQTIGLSMEGMEYNFEDVDSVLRKEILKQDKNDITVV